MEVKQQNAVSRKCLLIILIQLTIRSDLIRFKHILCFLKIEGSHRIDNYTYNRIRANPKTN